MPPRDETEERPLELLARYRKLCEAAGAAGAGGSPLPRDVREQLRRVEAELQSRLWLASAEPAGPNGPAAPERPIAPARRLPAVERLAEALEREPATPPGAVVFADGACIGNPGPGGYCAIVRVPGHPERTLSGGKARTTNNEMEMTAAREGLRQAISAGAREITVVSDSEYLVKGMTGWIRGWLKNGWKTSAGQPVKNRALWEELHELSRGRSVTWTWTRGHAGHPENERCDALAVAAAKQAATASGR
jgi:ribonuclease HI